MPRSQLLELLAPYSIGDRIEGYRFEAVSFELGLRLRFTQGEERIDVEVHPKGHGRPLVETAHLGFAYRRPPRTSTDAGTDPKAGQRLCNAVAALAAKNEEPVLAALQRSPASDARITRTDATSLLEAHGETGPPFYTLSPYVGCTIGCRFCYAQDHVAALRKLLGAPAVPWGSYVEVRQNAPALLAAELERLPPAPIKFCPVVSDPYQPLERKERLTRRCLEVIAEDRRFPILLLTRSQHILDDLPLLRRLPKAAIGVSLPTIDDTVRRHFEPRSASIPERLAVLEALQNAGIHTIAVAQPMLPGCPEDLAEALAPRVQSVAIDILRGTYGAEADFADPRYLTARSPSWQASQLERLKAALDARNVPLWQGELPPDWP